MTEFTFTIVFEHPTAESLEPLLDALLAAGCDDAAFMGPAPDGSFSAEFDREAETFADAVASALAAIASALPAVHIVRVAPDDLVTLAAIADRTGRSDESIRLLAQGLRGPGHFPAPLGQINDKTRIWSWADVAEWFKTRMNETSASSEHAAFLAAINHALHLVHLKERLRGHSDEVQAIAHYLPDREDLLAAAA